MPKDPKYNEPEYDIIQRGHELAVKYRKQYGETEITPEAFHCIHSHWRWSKAAEEKIELNAETQIVLNSAWTGGHL